MKTKEELKALKEEVETINKKLSELNEDELAQVFGGAAPHDAHYDFYNIDPTSTPVSDGVITNSDEYPGGILIAHHDHQ